MITYTNTEQKSLMNAHNVDECHVLRIFGDILERGAICIQPWKLCYRRGNDFRRT